MVKTKRKENYDMLLLFGVFAIIFLLIAALPEDLKSVIKTKVWEENGTEYRERDGVIYWKNCIQLNFFESYCEFYAKIPVSYNISD